MWAIKVLAGLQPGQIFNLQTGRNVIGRSDKASIVMQSSGISKEHLEIFVQGEKLTLKDLNSSNGTYLNGLRVQSAFLKSGDKIGIHNLIIELVRTDKVNSPAAVVNYQPQPEPGQSGLPAESLKSKIEHYINFVLLPGVYKLVDLFDYKLVLMGFAAIYVLIVTLLSIIPMNQITKESIENESRRRAQTVARALATANENVIRFGDYSKFSTDFVLREDGIDDVFIVSKDGIIIAPPERAGTRPKETGFIRQIQGQAKEISSVITNEKVAAAFPIVSYDADLQQNVAKAHAVVVFNVSSLKFDDGRAFSLFIQMLIIASIVGYILFFFIFKLIEYPIHRIHDEIDHSLKENSDHLSIAIKLPALQELLVTLNSLLTRALNPQSFSQSVTINRDLEMQNICQMIGYPSCVINRQGAILSINEGFESLTNMNRVQMVGQNYSQIPDQALQKNFADLMSKAQAQPHTIFTDQLEMNGHQLSIHCHAGQELEYYVFTLTPEGGGA